LLLPGEASAAEGKRPAALDFDLTLDPGELDPRLLAPGRLEELDAFLARRAQDPVAEPPKGQSDRRSVGPETKDWLAALGWFVD
jgi:hypothetical protein